MTDINMPTIFTEYDPNIALEVEALYHWFGDNKVLNNVNLKVKNGQFVSMVGPSGCGKSTLLRAILGTHPPKSGCVYAHGEVILKPNRHIGIVYQDYALYQFLTARENVAFGLALDKTSIPFRLFRPFSWSRIQKAHLKKADELLEKLKLSHAAHCYPSEMSGGMRQRVAIAQALIMRPSILLLDEPFGALDEATREEMQMMLLNLYQENVEAIKANLPAPTTLLIVTHELNEALYVSDRVIGLSQYHSDGKNGATIVYDKATPVFHPDDPRDFETFTAQKEEIREIVFNPEQVNAHKSYVSFFKDRTNTELPGK